MSHTKKKSPYYTIPKNSNIGLEVMIGAFKLTRGEWYYLCHPKPDRVNRPVLFKFGSIEVCSMAGEHECAKPTKIFLTCPKLAIIHQGAISNGVVLSNETFICTFANLRIKKASPAQIEKAEVILALPSL